MEMQLSKAPDGAKYIVEFKGNGYYIDGKRIKRVTTILGKFPDSGNGLIEWAKGRVALTIIRLLKDRVLPGSGQCAFPDTEIPGLVEMGHKNPDEVTDQTAEVGTFVHAIIEEWLKGGATEEVKQSICTNYLLPLNPGRLEIMQRAADIKSMSDAQRNLFYDQMKSYMFSRFCEFWLASGLTYVGSEIMVGSKRYMFGGRIDILARNRKGGLVLIDFKTSKHVSPSMFSQVAAYKLAYEEMTDQKIVKCAIVQCPREWTEKNMGFGVYPVKPGPYKSIFLFILKTWDKTEFRVADCRRDTL